MKENCDYVFICKEEFYNTKSESIELISTYYSTKKSTNVYMNQNGELLFPYNNLLHIGVALYMYSSVEIISQKIKKAIIQNDRNKVLEQLLDG